LFSLTLNIMYSFSVSVNMIRTRVSVMKDYNTLRIPLGSYILIISSLFDDAL